MIVLMTSNKYEIRGKSLIVNVIFIHILSCGWSLIFKVLQET